MGKIIKFTRKLICIPIKIYQFFLSPLMMQSCRFTPSCSQYAMLAITRHGVGKGLWLSTKRIARCHPWSEGGYDPVLPNEEKL